MNRGMLTLYSGDNRYPSILSQYKGSPKQLYAIGDVTLLQQTDKNFAIVGTRKPSGYGLQVTRLFAEKLAQAGMIIVSGMAYGIDSAAHAACLNAGGKTIAVLGGGADVIYPRANNQLYHRILDSGGLILSEQPPGQEPLPGMFVMRNRIISGISKGVMVVEGTHKSGSMITGRKAADQNKDVFVAPMPITTALSEGPLWLFREGARMVTSPEEILEELGIAYGTPGEIRRKKYPLSPEEKKILELLGGTDLSIDDIAASLQAPVAYISFAITSLELKEYIMKNIAGLYQRVK